MTDIDPFERQVAHEILLDVGPERQVDAMGVVRTVKELDSKGRFTMFSALKFVAAGAIVALFGGFLLVNLTPMPQGDEVIPGAVAESPEPLDWSEPVFFDITRTDGSPDDCSETSKADGVKEVTCIGAPSYYLEAGDPRLSGSVWGSLHEYGWGDGAISTELHVIESEGGSWRGTRQVVEARETVEWQGKPVLVLTGEGGYEGLTAAVFFRGDGTGLGIILSVPIPEPVEPEDPQPSPAAE